MRGAYHLFSLAQQDCLTSLMRRQSNRCPTVPSVDSGRIRYVLKERIGKVAAKVEPFR